MAANPEPKVILAAMASRFAGRPHWEFWLAVHLWTHTPEDGTPWRTTLAELVAACQYRVGARSEGPDAPAISRFLDRIANDPDKKAWHITKTTLLDRTGLDIARVTKRQKKAANPDSTAANATPDPTMRTFTDYFCLRWKEAHPDAVGKYPFAEDKDGTCAAKVWKYVGKSLPKAKAIVDNFFACDDPFYREDQTLAKMAFGLAKFAGGNGKTLFPTEPTVASRPPPLSPDEDHRMYEPMKLPGEPATQTAGEKRK